MSDIRLVYPDEDMEQRAMEFKNDFYENHEKIIYGSYKFDVERYSYTEWLQIIRDNLNQDTANPKFGVSQTFFAVLGNGEIVGVINFRHEITEFYKDMGQIGYSVRPGARRKGYAYEMLHQVLEMAKTQGVQEVYIVCDSTNEASRRTIQKNNAVLNRKINKDGEEHEEYRIVLR